MIDFIYFLNSIHFYFVFKNLSCFKIITIKARFRSNKYLKWFSSLFQNFQRHGKNLNVPVNYKISNQFNI